MVERITYVMSIRYIVDGGILLDYTVNCCFECPVFEFSSIMEA